MKRILLASCLVSSVIAGCAGGTGRAPASAGAPAGATASERQQFCRNQMYGERTARGRSAPNWNLYEHCMRQPAPG